MGDQDEVEPPLAKPLVGFDHITANVENPKPQTNSPSVNLSLGSSLGGAFGDRYVIVMVGLPATGKTHIARRLCQYLQFFHGSTTRVFNVGNYRRKLMGAKSPHEFFDPDNKESRAKRHELAQTALNDLKAWLKEGDECGRVAIFDATNSTADRRRWIDAELQPVLESRRKVMFIESIVNDEQNVMANINDTKLSSPDYEGMDAEAAVLDFKKRIGHYKKNYETISEDEARFLTFIKLIDNGRQITMNHISGFLPGRIVNFLMNIHTKKRAIYLSRHGQSEYNVLGKIGGDSSLSESGEAYAVDLAKFVHTNILGLNEDGSFKDESNRVVEHARLYTSSLQRTQLTARHIAHHKCDDGWVIMRPHVCPALDEIYAGVFDGMTYAEIQEKAPQEFKSRKDDKLGYRYPRGESYLDVIQRLDPIVHEIERQVDPVVVVGHQGILRILYCYFMGDSREDAPFISIPLNTVIKLEPKTYFCEVSRIPLNAKYRSNSHEEPPSH